tara:strand:+ start:1090 stop:1653 length:564 start_codon:yes stop_codon:yes gene_type:complete
VPFKSQAQRRFFYANNRELAEKWQKKTGKKRLPERVKTATSKEEIHRLADKKGIPWDDDPKFKTWSKKVTGKACLDDMNPSQLSRLKKALKERGMKKEATNLVTSKKNVPAAPSVPKIAPPPKNQLKGFTDKLFRYSPVKDLSLSGGSLNVGLAKDFNKSLSGNLDFSIPTRRGGPGKVFATLTKRF